MGESICSGEYIKIGEKTEFRLLWIAWDWKSNDCQNFLIKEAATQEDSGLYCSRITIKYAHFCKIKKNHQRLRSHEGTTIKHCELGSVIVLNQFNWKLICLVLIGICSKIHSNKHMFPIKHAKPYVFCSGIHIDF